MASSAHFRAWYATAGILLVVLLLTVGPPVHAATAPTATAHNSLLFTVYPNKSVGIGWNASTTFPVNQSISSLFQGYSIQSSSSFAQQSNAVVETTTVQYQLPPQIYTQLPYSALDSVSLSATEAGNSSSGSLTITTALPVQSLNIVFATSSTQISANATAQILFPQSSMYNGTPFANESIFQTTWAETFQNATWRDGIVNQIVNATSHTLFVQKFNGTVTYPSLSSASVSIEFLAIPSGSSTDFVTAFENSLSSSMTFLPSGIDSIIRQALKLVTGETLGVNYTNTTGKLAVTYTINYVSNLDAQLNSIKNQFFQLLLNAQPVGTITPQERFLNATSLTVSKITTTSNLDLYTGSYSMTLNGLLVNPINPPFATGTDTNFTLPGLFQTIGALNFSAPGDTITIAGGSDSSNQVRVIVPAGTLSPTSTTSNSATWTNVNASRLQGVRFLVQPIPFSFLAFLTSTPGFILEAVIAAAVIAGVALYARKRRSKMSPPVTPIGPTAPPGFSPGPPIPTQSTAVLSLQTSWRIVSAI